MRLTLNKFAPSSKSDMSVPPSPDPFSSDTSPSFNGYHLLNEVSTGGTLSSLFSILSLFTEDIKLPWGPDQDQDQDQHQYQGDGIEEEEEDHEGIPLGRPPTKSRTNSDVSQLDETIVGSGSGSVTGSYGESEREVDLTKTPRSPLAHLPIHRNSVSSTSTADDSTVRDTDSQAVEDGEEDGEGDITIDASASSASVLGFDHLENKQQRSVPNSGRESRSRSFKREHGTSSRRPKLGPSALDGTIARATVDTTLAVIPAEAFRKLTRKYPKASGTIVQVVLERFSRVTFMTGRSTPTTISFHAQGLTMSSTQVPRVNTRDPPLGVHPQLTRFVPASSLFLHWRRNAIASRPLPTRDRGQQA